MPSAARSRPGEAGEHAGRHAVHHQVIDEVGRRIAERRQFPVEHRRDPRLVGVRRSYCRSENRHGRCARRRCRAADCPSASRPARSICRHAAGLDVGFILLRPARDLPLDEAGGAAIVAKPDRCRIEAVQLGDGRVHRVEVRGALGRAYRPGKLASQTIRPSTRSMTKKGVPMTLSSSHRPWTCGTGKALAAKRAHHPRFALDRMGAGQQLARRLAAQDEGPARRRVEPVGRVGLAALELADGQRPGEAVDMVCHPSLERGDVEAQPLATSRVPVLASVRSMSAV